jgi:hypothetical protein
MGVSLAEASKSFHRAAIKSTIPRRLPQNPATTGDSTNKALCRTRTDDPFLTMEVLYQLS